MSLKRLPLSPEENTDARKTAQKARQQARRKLIQETKRTQWEASMSDIKEGDVVVSDDLSFYQVTKVLPDVKGLGTRLRVRKMTRKRDGDNVFPGKLVEHTDAYSHSTNTLNLSKTDVEKYKRHKPDAVYSLPLTDEQKAEAEFEEQLKIGTKLVKETKHPFDNICFAEIIDYRTDRSRTLWSIDYLSIERSVNNEVRPEQSTRTGSRQSFHLYNDGWRMYNPESVYTSVSAPPKVTALMLLEDLKRMPEEKDTPFQELANECHDSMMRVLKRAPGHATTEKAAEFCQAMNAQFARWCNNQTESCAFDIAHQEWLRNH
jgi:hypothetical protein